MVLSAFSFSLMSLCVKQLGGRIPVAEVVFIRALISLVLSWWVIQRQGVNPWGNRRPMLVWRGVVGTLALFCFYGAINQLPLAAATVLQYLYPTFTAALAWGALGERAGKRILLAMALGWFGVLLVAQPDCWRSSRAIAPWIPCQRSPWRSQSPVHCSPPWPTSRCGT